VGLEGKGIAESEDTDTGDVGFERVEKDEDWINAIFRFCAASSHIFFRESR
jgi:hypothetical protein